MQPASPSSDPVVAIFGGQGFDALRELKLLWSKSPETRGFIESLCKFIHSRLRGGSDEHPAADESYSMAFELLASELQRMPAACIALTVTLALANVAHSCGGGVMPWSKWEEIHAAVGHSSGALAALVLSKATDASDLKSLANSAVLLAVEIGAACYMRTYKCLGIDAGTQAAEALQLPQGSWMIGVAGLPRHRLEELLNVFNSNGQYTGPFQPDISLMNGEQLFSITGAPQVLSSLAMFLRSRDVRVVELNVELPYHSTEMQGVFDEAVAMLGPEEREAIDVFAHRRLNVPVWSGTGQADAPEGFAVLGWLAAEVCEAKVQWLQVCSKLRRCGAAVLDCGLGKENGIAQMTSHAIRGLRVFRPKDMCKDSVDCCCTCSHAFGKMLMSVCALVEEICASIDDSGCKKSSRRDDEELARKISELSDCCV